VDDGGWPAKSLTAAMKPGTYATLTIILLHKKMKKLFAFCMLLAMTGMQANAKNWYIATNGSDSNSGTISSPLASLKAALNSISGGDTIYVREGTYKPTTDDIMSTQETIYACVFDITKKGTAAKRTVIAGYPGERPVFDLSDVKPEEKRVAVFYLHADYVHLKNFDIIGTQVTITEHTQSECVTIRRGNSYNIVENVSVHDGMGIGFVIWKGGNNLILNCDAYNNYDSVSEGGNGGNVDGFGCHVRAQDTGNVFRGCRAWWNSDDGFDLISNLAPVTIDNCWAMYNGYKPNTFTSAADGNGFKAGGYGLKVLSAEVAAPCNIIKNCVAYRNKANGFYSNHHLAGNEWYNNSAYMNKYNYDMRNQSSWDVASDVNGYGHILKNNLSYQGVKGHYTYIDMEKSTLENNTFAPTVMTLTDNSFISLDYTQLVLPRKADGSLPDITFLKLKDASLKAKYIGYEFDYDDIPTGISELKANDYSSTDNAYYNLAGQRVSSPNYGIYIHKGKKIVIK